MFQIPKPKIEWDPEKEYIKFLKGAVDPAIAEFIDYLPFDFEKQKNALYYFIEKKKDPEEYNILINIIKKLGDELIDHAYKDFNFSNKRFEKFFNLALFLYKKMKNKKFSKKKLEEEDIFKIIQKLIKLEKKIFEDEKKEKKLKNSSNLESLEKYLKDLEIQNQIKKQEPKKLIPRKK